MHLPLQSFHDFAVLPPLATAISTTQSGAVGALLLKSVVFIVCMMKDYKVNYQTAAIEQLLADEALLPSLCLSVAKAHLRPYSTSTNTTEVSITERLGSLLRRLADYKDSPALAERAQSLAQQCGALLLPQLTGGMQLQLSAIQFFDAFVTKSDSGRNIEVDGAALLWCDEAGVFKHLTAQIASRTSTDNYVRTGSLLGKAGRASASALDKVSAARSEVMQHLLQHLVHLSGKVAQTGASQLSPTDVALGIDSLKSVNAMMTFKSESLQYHKSVLDAFKAGGGISATYTLLGDQLIPSKGIGKLQLAALEVLKSMVERVPVSVFVTVALFMSYTVDGTVWYGYGTVR